MRSGAAGVSAVGVAGASWAGSRVVGFVGPVSGAGKTTAAVMSAHAAAGQLAGPVTVVDLDPDPGLLRARLTAVPSPPAVLELVNALPGPFGVGSVNELLAHVGPAGQIRVAHKDGAPAADVRDLSVMQWSAVLDRLAGVAPLVLADGGVSLVSPAAEALWDRADHLVIAVRADVAEIALTCQLLSNRRQTHLHLLAGASVVMVMEDRPSALVRQGIRWFESNCACVVPVRWDRVLSGSGRIDVGRVAPSSRAAYGQITTHFIEVFSAAAAASESESAAGNLATGPVPVVGPAAP